MFKITTPTGTARNRQVSLLEEKVKSLEKSKAEQSNDIIVLKTKLMESERQLKEQRDVNVQRAEREVRYQSLHDENHRLTEELRKLKSECENTLSQSTAHKLATVETSSLAVMKRLGMIFAVMLMFSSFDIAVGGCPNKFYSKTDIYCEFER